MCGAKSVKRFQRAVLSCLSAGVILASAQAQAQVHQKAAPLVTIGPSVTEIVYALGAGDQIIGTDQSSKTPEGAKVAKLGYHRQLSAEGLISLKPSRIIGTDNMGPPAVLEQLKAAGVEVTIMPSGNTLNDLYRQINALADLFDRESAGAELRQNLQQDITVVNKLAEKAKAKYGRTTKVIYMMAYGGTPLIAGDNTTLDSLISLVGAQNPAKVSFSGYKPVTAEALLTMAPDVILVGQAVLNTAKNADGVLKLLPGIQTTPAGKNKAVVAIDDTALMSGFSPRIGDVALTLANDIYK